MTQNNRAVQDKVTNTATLPVVNITAANTSLLNMDAYIILVPQLWYFSILK